jgi:hypothetical protein
MTQSGHQAEGHAFLLKDKDNASRIVFRGQTAFPPANFHPADNNKREQAKQAEHRAPDERPEKSARTGEVTFAGSEADPDEDDGQSKRDRDPERAA